VIPIKFETLKPPNAQRQDIKERPLRRSRRQEGIGTRRNMDKKE
jgi:hypothetical protein